MLWTLSDNLPALAMSALIELLSVLKLIRFRKIQQH